MKTSRQLCALVTACTFILTSLPHPSRAAGSSGGVAATPKTSPSTPAAPPPMHVLDATASGGAGGGGVGTGSQTGIGSAESGGFAWANGLSLASASPSTGIGVASLPLILPTPRGTLHHNLALNYASARGDGFVGAGWDLGLPAIERKNPRGGAPSYHDYPSPDADTYLINGVPLVPICAVSSGRCVGSAVTPLLADEGAIYFRPEVETGFARFVFRANRRSWVAERKTGEIIVFGDMPVFIDPIPRPGNAIDTDRRAGNAIFRWNIAAQFDQTADPHDYGAGPSGYNQIAYVWEKGPDDIGYLRDIFDTKILGTAAIRDPYEHHVKLWYELPSYSTTGLDDGVLKSPVWRQAPRQRLYRIDITTASDNVAGRELVRRYHFRYNESFHHSFLAGLQLEGHCGAYDENTLYSGPTPCPRLPEARLTYNLPTLVPTTFSMGAIPQNMDTTISDVDSDGQPDLLMVDDPNRVLHVFLNSPNMPNTLVERPVGPQLGALGNDPLPLLPGPLWDGYSTMFGDFLGDGRLNILQRAPDGSYGDVSTLAVNASGQWDLANTRRFPWMLRSSSGTGTYSALPTPSPALLSEGQSTSDVDGDGYLDVIRFANTFYHEITVDFTTLQWDGSVLPFGIDASGARVRHSVVSCDVERRSSSRTDDTTATQTFPNSFGDMNGDGLPDLVSVRSLDVAFWPGNGDGSFGIQSCLSYVANAAQQPTCDCSASHELPMGASPHFASTAKTYLHDLDADGLDDLVVVGDDITVWWNTDGTQFSPYPMHVAPSTIPGWPYVAIRFADMNSSGSEDLVTIGGGQLNYIDFLQGGKPGLLVQITNGRGATTAIEYSALADLARGANPKWTTQTPQPLHVVTRVSTNTAAGGQAAVDLRFAYTNPVYNARDHGFVGFQKVRTTRLGSFADPTSHVETTFLTTLCPQDQPQPCPSQQEDTAALRGLPVLVEQFDDNGVYLSTTHNEYKLQTLLPGLDRRVVRTAYVDQVDTWLYDTGPFAPLAGEPLRLQNVVDGDNGTMSSSFLVSVRGVGKHLRMRAQHDDVGNVTDVVDFGTVDVGANDRPIARHLDWTIPKNANGTQASDWRWRMSASETGYYSNGAFVDQTRKFTYDYYANGALRSITGRLADVGGLDFFEESGGPTITNIAGQAFARDVTLAWFTYDDATGNALRIVEQNNHCKAFEYDSTFGQWLTTVTRGSSSTDPLTGKKCDVSLQTTLQQVDRVQERITMSLSQASELSVASYDAFGRLATMTKPSPFAPGALSTWTSLQTQYLDPQDGVQLTNVRVHDPAASSSNGNFRETWTYTDGFGRTILTLNSADTSAGDGGDWVLSGMPVIGSSGNILRSYRPIFWSGDAANVPLSALPSRHIEQTALYDAFGRLISTRGAANNPTSKFVYHALAHDSYDGENLKVGGPHANLFSTSESDGHGRPIRETNRIRLNPASAFVDAITITSTYSGNGDVLRVDQTHAGKFSDDVSRQMAYDTFGRMVLNVESNTTYGSKSWHYAYNDNGALVGSSDARGCGEQFQYDVLGRLVAEDYSPCLDSQPRYTNEPEITYTYDVPEAGQIGNAAFFEGRLVSMRDRGSHTRFTYNGRGHITSTERQIAKPSYGGGTGDDRYAPHWFRVDTTLDDADHVVGQSTGADLTELFGNSDSQSGVFSANGASIVKADYSARGFLKHVGGSYGTILDTAANDEVGLPLNRRYGDAAHTTATYTYDHPRYRLSNVNIARTAPGFWSQAPSTSQPPSTSYAPPADPKESLQTTLENLTIKSYDEVGNPTEIDDGRIGTEWESGAQPENRAISYDDFYRVTDVVYTYPNGPGQFVSPFASEIARADPRVPKTFGNHAARIKHQAFSYDWLGNTASSTDDDPNGFYERSLGALTNGTQPQAPGPNQLSQAVGAQGGTLNATYDHAGNLATVSVLMPGICPGSCVTTFAYDWDEVGHLAQARRWDPGMPYPGTASFAQKFTYDGNGARVTKGTLDTQTGFEKEFSANIFKSLRLDGASWDDKSGDYERTNRTESAYLIAGGTIFGRLLFAQQDEPTLSSGHLHVFLELGDALGSTQTVIDQETGELVERGTYQPYGAAESDYRSSRWGNFREEQRFTGKEDDFAFGLTYFGARYYSTALGRWASPDPVAIHDLRSDINPYAYVGGRVTVATDPYGLQIDTGLDNGDNVLNGNTGWNGVIGYNHDGNQCMGKECSGPGWSIDLTGAYDASAPGGTTVSTAPAMPAPVPIPAAVAAADETSLLKRFVLGAAGLALGYVEGAAPGGMGIELVMPEGMRNNKLLRYWQGAGQVIGGTVGITNGSLEVGGGRLATNSGPYAPGGLAVTALGTLSIANGVFAMGNGFSLMAQNNPNTGDTQPTEQGTKASQTEKKAVRQENRDAHDGKLTCENCGRDDLVDPQRARGDVPRPENEAQVDHIVPREKGGQGARPNLRVLCPSCNKPGVIPR